MFTRSQRFHVDYEYPVVFSRQIFDRNNASLSTVMGAPVAGPHRAIAIVDDGLAAADPKLIPRLAAYAEAHPRALSLVAPPFVMRAGEACKNDPRSASDVQRLIARHGIDRHGFVLAIGGGALLDMVGFAAATAHRGVRLIRVPTTTLSQADSGVGVKCGVNAWGLKNYLGAFAPPHAVLIDAELLRSLPARERIAGLAEGVKVALIRDHSLFEWIEARTLALGEGDEDSVEQLVRRAALLHLEHIERGGDPFERGSARPLDFGHWAAHRLESATGHRLRHGEAVAIGMAIDVRISVAVGLLDEGSAERAITVLERLGLPIWDLELTRRVHGRLAILEGLEEFRQHLGGALSVPLLTAIGSQEPIASIDPGHVERAVDWLGHRVADDELRVAG